MAASLQAISQHLATHRLRHDQLPDHKPCGLYAYFVDNPGYLLPVTVEENGLIFVAMAEDGTDARCHFTQPSGFSALRRTLGAILKHRLELTAVPRGNRDTPRNSLHYGFAPESEARLSDWMKTHLTYGCYPGSEGMALMEKELIRHMCPPLCLSAWKNKQGILLRGMRKACSDEALIKA